MAESKINFDALGQASDTTWGRSSTPKTSSYSVKVSMLGPTTIKASYAVIVNFGSERQMIETKRRYAEESIAIISEVLKTIKANYKSLTGSSLSTKEVGSQDNIEIISATIHNPKKTAYYKRQTVFEVG
jgi:hypothetical protein